MKSHVSFMLQCIFGSIELLFDYLVLPEKHLWMNCYVIFKIWIEIGVCKCILEMPFSDQYTIWNIHIKWDKTYHIHTHIHSSTVRTLWINYEPVSFYSSSFLLFFIFCSDKLFFYFFFISLPLPLYIQLHNFIHFPIIYYYKKQPSV